MGWNTPVTFQDWLLRPHPGFSAPAQVLLTGHAAPMGWNMRATFQNWLLRLCPGLVLELG